MGGITDIIAFDYFSNSMNYSFIGFILGYVIGRLQVTLVTWIKGKRKKNG